MATSSILIVDDEEPARKRLQRLISSFNKTFKISIAENGLEAIEKIKNDKPDIVFLDIQMPGVTGLEVLQQIENRNFKVIFQTAYDEYALKAFEENACDYLLKPYEINRFSSALNKALEQKSSEEKLNQLEEMFLEKGQYLESIGIKVGNKMLSIKVSDIYNFTSHNHYTGLYTERDEYIIDLSLTHLEARLDPNMFFRCHRSHIINIKKLSTLQLGPLMKAKLQNNKEIPISRQNRKCMKEKIKNELN